MLLGQILPHLVCNLCFSFIHIKNDQNCEIIGQYNSSCCLINNLTSNDKIQNETKHNCPTVLLFIFRPDLKSIGESLKSTLKVK